MSEIYIEYFSLFEVSYAPISFFTLLFDHTAIYNFTVLIIFLLLFDRCLLVTFGDFVVVPMTPSKSRDYQITSQSFNRPLPPVDLHWFYEISIRTEKKKFS